MIGSAHRWVKTFLTSSLLLVTLSSQARIGAEFQMPLGNPSGAVSDPRNHTHYLTQRRVFAMDYDDQNGEPNWVSWDFRPHLAACDG